jgi:hypothetical protein
MSRINSLNISCACASDVPSWSAVLLLPSLNPSLLPLLLLLASTAAAPTSCKLLLLLTLLLLLGAASGAVADTDTPTLMTLSAWKSSLRSTSWPWYVSARLSIGMLTWLHTPALQAMMQQARQSIENSEHAVETLTAPGSQISHGLQQWALLEAHHAAHAALEISARV